MLSQMTIHNTNAFFALFYSFSPNSSEWLSGVLSTNSSCELYLLRVYLHIYIWNTEYGNNCTIDNSLKMTIENG